MVNQLIVLFGISVFCFLTGWSMNCLFIQIRYGDNYEIKNNN